jgi:cellulose synthase/poly-beta-1,6-N-acetylglucosamine synthase-like glycosyltransferase
VIVAKVVFWGALAALLWTHLGYPLTAGLAARLRPRRVALGSDLPTVTLVVAAHDEEPVIARRLDNLLDLDYPRDRLELVVASDASTDRTDEIVESFASRGVRLERCPRGGKVAAQNRAVGTAAGEIVAFSDANATWAPDALRKLVRSFADPEVAYVCGRLQLETGDGRNKEGVYWRYEMALRSAESKLDSVTGGNGSIYAVRRHDYVEVDPRFGHDLSLPYVLVQRGLRAVYDPEALAYEKATPSNEDEYRRKVRMFEHCWAIVLEGKMLRGLRPLYLLEVISHRHLRYASGVLHLLLLAANLVLVGRGGIYAVALGLQLGLLLAAAVGVGIARYYVLVTWATVVALWNYLRRGVPTTWEAAEGTR